MFYFEIGKTTYAVKFLRDGVNRTTTIAELYEVVEGKLVHTGAFGIASVHYTDQFVKKVGRKVALSYLLDGLSLEDSVPLFTKEDRTLIWSKYFETFKK